MGCNCGKKNLNRISKYTDDGQDFNEDGGIIVKAVQWTAFFRGSKND